VGANYRSPQSRPTPPWEEPKAPAPGFQSLPPIRPAAATPPSAAAPAPPVQALPSPAPSLTPPVPAPHPGALSEAFRTIQEGLAAMQALQQQTAAAHQRFLEGQ